MSTPYAGNITPSEAWKILEEQKDAVLIDVRTAAEWAWVGQVDLSALGKSHLCVEWVRFPGGVSNDDFVGEVSAKGIDQKAPILFLCRSGVRSQYAAIALTQAGYQACYNISGGFEGDADQHKHRGQTNGWKFEGLPWVQG
jgi:rhodanese-related sulfurtransferase